MKRRARDWKKRCACQVKHCFKIHIKNFIKLSKKITQFSKWTENLNRNVTKEDTQMSNKHTKWWLTLLVSMEMEMEMKTRHHDTTLWMVQWSKICKNTDNINCCQGSGATGLSHAAGRTDCNMARPLWKTFWQYLVTSNTWLPHTPSIHTYMFIQEKWNHWSHKASVNDYRSFICKNNCKSMSITRWKDTQIRSILTMEDSQATKANKGPRISITWMGLKCIMLSWKKEDRKGCVMYESMYITNWKRQNYRDSKKISGCRKLWGEAWTDRAQRLFRAVKLLCMIL